MSQAPSVAAPVQDAGDALRASLAGALATFLGAIPRVIAFALVLAVGWLLASLLARAIGALLHAIRFDDLARRSGFAGFVRNMGVRQDPADVVAEVGKWFVRLIALVVAFDALGLPAVSGVLREFLLWLPNLVVALVVLVIGGLAANAVSRLARGAAAGAGFADPDPIATAARIAVWGFAIVVAVGQLGIATTLVDTLLIGIVGGASLAAGLAFGLGGRDRAAALLDRWSRRAAEAGPRLERSAAVATRQADEEVVAIGSGDRDGPPVPPPLVEQRSGVDRRRVPRPGPDRRGVGRYA